MVFCGLACLILFSLAQRALAKYLVRISVQMFSVDMGPVGEFLAALPKSSPFVKPYIISSGTGICRYGSGNERVSPQMMETDATKLAWQVGLCITEQRRGCQGCGEES